MTDLTVRTRYSFLDDCDVLVTAEYDEDTEGVVTIGFDNFQYALTADIWRIFKEAVERAFANMKNIEEPGDGEQRAS